MDRLLSNLESPRQLQSLSVEQLQDVAAEIRKTLCNLVSSRTAHFASNLGVVELCLSLHSVFDFGRDRLIWDTGHQIYPHKMVTGRYQEIGTIRCKGGLMGYPNPQESDYDLFMTGHAGCSVSTVLGLRQADVLRGEADRHAVAVIGDGALPSGIVFEALNNAGGLKSKLLIILNDNKMSICPRVGGMAAYLDKLRLTGFYSGLKSKISRGLGCVPVVGEPLERFLSQAKDSLKAGLHGGMLFEELGVRYMGPVDGHNIGQLVKYLKMVKDVEGPVLLHVFTEKGHGFEPAAADPVFFHTPPAFQCDDDGVITNIKRSSTPAYTNVASQAIFDQMQRDERVTVLTAAMCQGTNLEKVRDAFPQRFFDTGICESHAVAFAAGMAKSGLRPVVDIYSTFLQRSYDQIFQEVALQALPVTFLLDRAGLTGPDGPTHHGCFDLGYLRVFPNLVVMAPGDAADLPAMLEFSLGHDRPCAIRYPKAVAETLPRDAAPIELGRSEVLSWGEDGMLIACGTLLSNCVTAARRLRDEEGLDVGVINARFIKPLDSQTLLRAIEQAGFVLTIEEGCLHGGFGSALLEAASDAGCNTSHVRRLGIPDQFIEHGERGELLADLGLDVAGIVQAARAAAQQAGLLKPLEQRTAG